ncbi:hypothetical protein NL676_037749 [Syzygium grande]|nr:hypothetical protein NL676_037749 [Syzygium grande]
MHGSAHIQYLEGKTHHYGDFHVGSRRLFLLRTQPPQSPQPPRFAVAAGAEVEEREGYDLRPDLGNGGAHARPASHEPAAQRARRVPVAEPPVQAGPVEDVVAALQLPDLLPDPDLAQAHRALRGRSAAVPGRAEPVVHSESPGSPWPWEWPRTEHLREQSRAHLSGPARADRRSATAAERGRSLGTLRAREEETAQSAAKSARVKRAKRSEEDMACREKSLSWEVCHFCCC